jgi:ParB family transcriptional regulator, chromosome partitioning protein
MKAAEELKARLGGNMRESMGAVRPGPAADSAPPDPAFHGGTAAKYRGAARIKDALSIDLDRLAPDPDQPRKEFEPGALAELAESLKARGQLQPIRVRWDEPSARWVVIAGERRYRAALLAGLPALACIEARGPLSPDDVLEDQLVENALRQDLKPIEQAHAFRALIDRRGWSYRQLGEALHIAPSSIARALALLDLPGDLQGRVTAGELAPSVAYEVSRIEDHDRQREVADQVVHENLSRAEAVAAVRRAGGPSGKAKGRDGAGARRVTSRAYKAAGGKVTVEHRRGLDDALIVAMLREVVAGLEAGPAAGDRDQAAA